MYKLRSNEKRGNIMIIDDLMILLVTGWVINPFVVFVGDIDSPLVNDRVELILICLPWTFPLILFRRKWNTLKQKEKVKKK